MWVAGFRIEEKNGGKVRSIHLASVYAETEIMFTVCEAFLCVLWFKALEVQSVTLVVPGCPGKKHLLFISLCL